MYQTHLKIISIILFAALIWFFAGNWNEILSVFSTIDLSWAMAGFGFYVVNYGFRGGRLKLLTGSGILDLRQAAYFSILHGFFSYLLPLRTGDASLPMLLKSTGQVSVKTGVKILIQTRVMDLSMLGIFTVLGALQGARVISSTIHGIWLATGIGLSASWFVLSRATRVGHYILKQKLKYDMDTSGLLRFHSRGFMVTFWIWLSVYASQYCMVRSIGLELTLAEVIFLSAIQFPLQLLPVQGLANAGNHEGGWVSALVLMGFHASDALTYAVVSHGVVLIYVALLGLTGMIISNTRRVF